MSDVTFSNIATDYDDKASVQKSAGDVLINLLGIKGNDNVLDIGCGTGELTRKIRSLTTGRVVGVDPSQGMIDEAINNSKDCQITFENNSAENLTYEDDFNVVFCNSTFQWFKEPEKAVENLYRGLTKGSRIGIQAPAKEIYSPNFIRAIDEVRYDHRTRGTFLRFKNPWFFLEAAEEYKTLFEQAGFRVIFSQIECIKTYHTPEVTYNIFASGAIAGYLNQDYYDVPIDEGYIETFKSIVRDAFVNQANSEGLVELVFNRIYLVAEKD